MSIRMRALLGVASVLYEPVLGREGALGVLVVIWKTQIARGMGKLTIAEFVSNQETVEVLRRLGVDYGQGYFLGRPKPLAKHLAAPSGLPRRPRLGREMAGIGHKPDEH